MTGCIRSTVGVVHCGQWTRLIFTDSRSAEAYWRACGGLPFYESWKKAFVGGRVFCSVELSQKIRQWQPFFDKVLAEVRLYDKQVRSGELHGAQMELHRQYVFGRFAICLNELESLVKD